MIPVSDFSMDADFTVDFWTRVRGVVCYSDDCKQCKHRLRCITNPSFKINKTLFDISPIGNRDASMYINGENVIKPIEVDLNDWTHVAIVRRKETK